MPKTTVKTTNQTPNPGPGRKIDRSRDSEILEAALQVFAEMGFERMTMDQVAATAHAGKGAIYRRWTSKTELILDAVSRMKREMVDLENLPDTGRLRSDLLALYKPESAQVSQFRMQIMAGLISMISHHSELIESVNQLMVKPWADAYLTLITRAIARGEVAATVDAAAIALVVPSMAAYRSLILRQRFDKTFLLGLVDGVVMPALGLPSPSSNGNKSKTRRRK